MAERYLIAIASYRRPTQLEHLLDSLGAMDRLAGADILVVDNDPEESARSVAENHRVEPIYVVEPAPGIAEARNRALQHFSNAYHGIIFVDDDEWVTQNWLTGLTDYAKQASADVVVGPVVTVFSENTPDWLRRGGFLQRQILETGTRLPTAPTNNTLLLRDAWVRAGSPRFDPSFSETGGSDADLFRGICKSGATILYCAEAAVHEDAPDQRLSLRWLRRRAIRNGIAQTRIRLKHGDSMVRGLGGGIVYMAYGAVFLAVGVITGRGLEAKPFNYFFSGYGRFAALFNYRIREYARN
jgi:succinoglycan biosynthesis protein ExoM